MRLVACLMMGSIAAALAGCGEGGPAAEASGPAPEGRYRLEWKKLESADVKIRVRTEGGGSGSGSGTQQDAGTMDVELSSRNGRLSGCSLTDPTSPNGATGMSGTCRMKGDLLLIDLGEEQKAAEGIGFELSPASGGAYSGSLFLKSMLIPGGKMAFAAAEMTPLPTSAPPRE